MTKYLDTDARFSALLKAAVDAIVLIDEHGIIDTFSPAAEKIFGYRADQVIGKNVSMLMPEPYSSQHDHYLHNYHRTNKAKIIGIGREVRAKRANGEIFPIELSVGQIDDRMGRMYVGIIRDITARVEAQREASDNRERLAHVTRVSTMGEMASGIAHEINQPLTAIATYAQACRHLLEKETLDRTQLSAVLDKISNQALRAGEVIRRLRAFFKKRKSEYEPCDLNEVIRDSVDIAHVDTRLLDHPVILDLASELPKVLADNVQIQQVVLNLLRNAIDAMETSSGEKVTIRSRRHDDESLEVIVCDRAGGIDPTTASQLFNPFFSTKDTGMGMGLAICQSIIRAHGGRLWHAPIDGGSEFHFTVPIAP